MFAGQFNLLAHRLIGRPGCKKVALESIREQPSKVNSKGKFRGYHGDSTVCSSLMICHTLTWPESKRLNHHSAPVPAANSKYLTPAMVHAIVLP
jgi:hypothetical protein